MRCPPQQKKNGFKSWKRMCCRVLDYRVTSLCSCLVWLCGSCSSLQALILAIIWPAEVSLRKTVNSCQLLCIHSFSMISVEEGLLFPGFSLNSSLKAVERYTSGFTEWLIWWKKYIHLHKSMFSLIIWVFFVNYWTILRLLNIFKWDNLREEHH